VKLATAVRSPQICLHAAKKAIFHKQGLLRANYARRENSARLTRLKASPCLARMVNIRATARLRAPLALRDIMQLLESPTIAPCHPAMQIVLDAPLAILASPMHFQSRVPAANFLVVGLKCALNVNLVIFLSKRAAQIAAHALLAANAQQPTNLHKLAG